MQNNGTPPPDGQDQTGAEIKKLKRSVSILSVCCFVQALTIGGIVWQILRIVRTLALLNQNIQIITQSIQLITQNDDLITQNLHRFYDLLVKLVGLL